MEPKLIHVDLLPASVHDLDSAKQSNPAIPVESRILSKSFRSKRMFPWVSLDVLKDTSVAV